MRDLWVKVVLRSDKNWQWILCSSEDWVNDQVVCSNPEQRIASEVDAETIGINAAIFYGNFKEVIGGRAANR